VNITVNKADAIVSVTGYAAVYDGKAHGASGSARGVKTEDLSGLLNLGATFTNVPGGTASWTFAGTGNYNAASGTARIDISKADSVIAVNGYTGVYDGAAHGANGAATGVEGESLPGLDLGATFTDVPGGTANWTFAGAGNYKATSGTLKIDIAKAEAVIVVNGYTGIYDGNAHGATGSATGVMGESLAGLDLGATFISVPGGTADWTFAGTGNYNAASGTARIDISKADAVIAVNGYTGVYDGAAHGATGGVTGVKGENLTGLDLGATFTDVPGGTAHWSFAGDTNYTAQSGDVAITITQANPTVTVTGYANVYDGAAHGATGGVTGVKGESLSGLDLGATFTDVPGGTAHWSFAGDTNYTARSGDVAITITQANPTVTVAGYTGVYDGAPHGATGAVTGVKGESLPALDLGAKFTDVPGGAANWTFAGTGNYKAANGTVQIDIAKANAVIAVNGYTGVYDGNAHGATGTATGVAGENLTALLNLGASFTNVPGGTATWSFAGDGNYTRASSTATVTISKANATITVNGYTGVYDGIAHGGTGSATGAKGETLSALLNLGGTFIDVPGGSVHWAFYGNDNYNNSSGDVAVIINKADQQISWANPAPIIFGTPLGSTQLNAVVTKGDGALTYTPSAGTILPVGQQALRVDAAATLNYKAATATVTVTVNPWYLTGFYSPVTMSAKGGPIVVNAVKGGSTVPLKFNLYASNGGTELTNTADIASFQVAQMSCGIASFEDPVDVTTIGGTSLRYDLTGRQFIQNWQTPKPAGVCYQVMMTAKDGTAIAAFFKTK
jgi:hypothetical protein